MKFNFNYYTPEKIKEISDNMNLNDKQSIVEVIFMVNEGYASARWFAQKIMDLAGTSEDWGK